MNLTLQDTKFQFPGQALVKRGYYILSQKDITPNKLWSHAYIFKLIQIIQQNYFDDAIYSNYDILTFPYEKIHTRPRKETLIQVFSSEFCEMFKNSLFTGYLRTIASGYNIIISDISRNTEKCLSFQVK